MFPVVGHLVSKSVAMLYPSLQHERVKAELVQAASATSLVVESEDEVDELVEELIEAFMLEVDVLLVDVVLEDVVLVDVVLVDVVLVDVVLVDVVFVDVVLVAFVTARPSSAASGIAEPRTHAARVERVKRRGKRILRQVMKAAMQRGKCREPANIYVLTRSSPAWNKVTRTIHTYHRADPKTIRQASKHRKQRRNRVWKHVSGGAKAIVWDYQFGTCGLLWK